MADAAAGVEGIAVVAVDDVAMEMKDGLAGGLAAVHAQVIAIGMVTSVIQKHEVLIKEEQANLILEIKSLKEDLIHQSQNLDNNYSSKVNQLREDLHQLSFVIPKNSLHNLKNKLNQWSIKIKITKLEKDQKQLIHKITHDLNLS